MADRSIPSVGACKPYRNSPSKIRGSVTEGRDALGYKVPNGETSNSLLVHGASALAKAMVR